MNILTALGKKQLIKEKYVYLFETCNLSCVFCWQDHALPFNIDKIQSTLQQIYKEEPFSHTIYNIMGGELFMTNVPNEVVNTYSKDLEFHPHKIYNWLTNLIIPIHRFEMFLSQLPENCVWSTSYDPCGRFNRAQLSHFNENIRYLSTKGYRPQSVSIVLTVQTINAIMNGDETFQYLYDNKYPLFFDFLSLFNSPLFESMLPKESLVQKFFLFLIDVYPDVGPIKEWIDEVPIKMSCRESEIISSEEIIGNCVTAVDTKSKSKIPLVDLSSNCLQNTYIEKRQCLSCEFFDKCPLGCFLNHQTNGFEDLPDGECMYRNSLRYIQSKNFSNKYNSNQKGISTKVPVLQTIK